MRTDTIASATVLVLSAFFLVFATKIPETKVTNVSSAVFPMIVLSIMAILSGINLYSSLKKSGTPKELKQVNNKNIIFTLVMLFATVLSMDLLGFVLSVIMFTTIVSVFIKGEFTVKEVAKALLLAVIAAFAIKYIFIDVLQLTLPEGIIFRE